MELEGVKLWNLWIVAGVVAGFQIGAFRWRIERELRMEDKCEPVWFPLTDYMLVLSFMALLVWVFILPTLGIVPVECAARGLVASMIPLGVYPFGLIGHYQLFLPREGRINRGLFPIGERWILGGGMLLFGMGVAYAVLACCGGSLWGFSLG